MSSFFITPLIILGVISAIYFVHYVWTLPERRENEEILRRNERLYEEQHHAEVAKHIARVAGEIARENINKIAKSE